ncbi:MAG: aspartate aminotransferase family protein [Candidatus Omnitrophota bacterium]
MSGYKFTKAPKSVRLVHTRNRRIKTKIPVPASIAILKELERVESRSMHGQLPVVWNRAKDYKVFDRYGNCWIDFTSTIFVTNSGHANPKIVSALKKALDQDLLHSYTFANESRVKFLRKLIAITPRQFQKAFLLSSGTEATECALKLARLYGQTIRPSKRVIISFKGSMHGRTMGAEMLKGDPASSAWIGHRDPHIYHLQIPYPWTMSDGESGKPDWGKRFTRDIKALQKRGLKPKNIAGFFIESYVGWAAYFYPKDYIKALNNFAKKNKSLLIFDDIQGGFGRSGKLFAYQHYGVKPDILCIGKALSGSLPLSAVLGSRGIMDLPGVGSMSSTHSANPLCCTAGLANLEVIEEGDLVGESARKGNILRARLAELKERFSNRIAYYFSNGLIAAIIFKDPVTGKPDVDFSNRVCEKAMQKGLLLVHTGRESVKIGPPLTIPDSALIEGLDVFEEAILEADKTRR